MKMKNLHILGLGILFLALVSLAKGQAPVANFTVSPTVICTGSANVIQINDLSTNNPTGWSYTVAAGGTGPGPSPSMTFAVQNPTLSFNTPGVYSITLIVKNSSGISSPVTYTVRAYPSPNANINPQVATICPGAGPINIMIVTGGTATPVFTYSWSTSATTSSITVTPTASTVYSCVITASSGCSATRVSTINVSQPTITLNSVPAAICPGSSSTITATPSGTGTWTYLWSDGSTNASVSTTLAGVYTATVSNTNGCVGTASYTLGTSSTLSLTASSNQTAICSGNAAFLSVSGANNYTWSTTSTVTTIMVMPTVSTSYSVTGELGSCTGTTSIFITVSQMPTVTAVSSATAVCAGGTIALTANGATTYTWLPGSVLTQSIIITPGANATYTVRGANPGCNVRSATISVNVMPNPVLSVSSSSTTICPGEVVALAASGANTYGWSSGSTSPVIIVTPMVTTSYTVTGYDTNGCSAQYVATQHVSECTGIEQLALSGRQLAVYPNPNNGEFVLESDRDCMITIYNALGKVVYSGASLAGRQIIDLGNEASGIYFVKTASENKTQTLKLIKQ